MSSFHSDRQSGKKQPEKSQSTHGLAALVQQSSISKKQKSKAKSVPSDTDMNPNIDKNKNPVVTDKSNKSKSPTKSSVDRLRIENVNELKKINIKSLVKAELIHWCGRLGIPLPLTGNSADLMRGALKTYKDSGGKIIPNWIKIYSPRRVTTPKIGENIVVDEPIKSDFVNKSVDEIKSQDSVNLINFESKKSKVSCSNFSENISDISSTSDSNSSSSSSTVQSKTRKVKRKSSRVVFPSYSHNVSKIVKNWNLYFNNTTSSIDFLEKLMECQEVERLSDSQMFTALPIILQGFPLSWFRNRKESITNFSTFLSEFKKYFSIKNLKENIEDLIRARKQKPNEFVGTYIEEMLTLFRRHGRMSNLDKIRRLWANTSPVYRVGKDVNSFETLEHLISFLREAECLNNEIVQFNKASKSQLFNKPFCTFCKRNNHSVEFCFKLNKNKSFNNNNSNSNYKSSNSRLNFTANANKFSNNGNSFPQNKFNNTSFSNKGNNNFKSNPSARLGNNNPVSKKFSEPVICFSCNQPNHISRNCPDKFVSNSKNE